MMLPLKYMVSAFGGFSAEDMNGKPRAQKEYAIVPIIDKYDRVFTSYLVLINVYESDYTPVASMVAPIMASNPMQEFSIR